MGQSVDSVLKIARERAVSGVPEQTVAIRRRTLALLVEEIDTLRTQLTTSVSTPFTRVRTNAHATERKAAQGALGRSGSQRFLIAQYIAACGDDGATDDEVARALDMMPPRVATRRGELAVGGFVVESGRERKTRNGQDAIVWVATDKARAALRTTN